MPELLIETGLPAKASRLRHDRPLHGRRSQAYYGAMMPILRLPGRKGRLPP
jgi:hypothetical protein